MIITQLSHFLTTSIIIILALCPVSHLTCLNFFFSLSLWSVLSPFITYFISCAHLFLIYFISCLSLSLPPSPISLPVSLSPSSPATLTPCLSSLLNRFTPSLPHLSYLLFHPTHTRITHHHLFFFFFFPLLESTVLLSSHCNPTHILISSQALLHPILHPSLPLSLPSRLLSSPRHTKLMLP